MARTPRVDVPSREDFDELAARVTQTEIDIADLTKRVEALEESAGVDEPEDGVQAERIADTIERFGVNTFSSMDEHNVWGSWPADYRPEQVVAALEYMTGGSGFTFGIREYHYAGRESFQQPWMAQIRASLPDTKFCMAVGANGTVADVRTMLSMADLLSYAEGLNEPNTDFGSGEVPVETTHAIQAELFGTYDTNGPLLIMGPSIVAGMPHPEGWITGYCGDYLADICDQMHNSNAHYYPPGQPDAHDGTGLEDYCRGVFEAYRQNEPLITEFHPTLYNQQGNQPGAQLMMPQKGEPFRKLKPQSDTPVTTSWSGDRDAYYTLMALLRCATLDTMIWWYALFDYGTTYQCGLFPKDANNPRPAADALHRLCQICADTSENRRTFGPGKLDVAVQAPSYFSSHLSQKEDGTFLLFIWNAQTEPGGATQRCVVRFADAFSFVLHDLMTGASHVYSERAEHQLDIPATVCVLVI